MTTSTITSKTIATPKAMTTTYAIAVQPSQTHPKAMTTKTTYTTTSSIAIKTMIT